jgi:hypothetical protein
VSEYEDDDIAGEGLTVPEQTPQAQAQAPAPAEAEAPELVFADVYEWVDEWLLPHWRRELEYWDKRWWLYPEVLSRFEALWRAWEFLRLEGALGMSVFWRDHLESHMRVITAENGPFWQVRSSMDYTGEPPAVWPAEPADREAGRIEFVRDRGLER